MKTYEIKAEFFALQELLESEEFNEETGELIDNTKELADLLEEIEAKREDKLINIEYVKQEYLNSVDALKIEVKRLQERQKSFLKKVDKLKQLQEYLLDGEKVETDIFTFGFRKSKQVEIIDEGLIDSKYLKEKILMHLIKSLSKKI